MADMPTAGNYNIDASHTEASFTVRHMGLARVRGGFTGVTGVIVVGEDAASSSVEVTIDASTFDSGAEDRDNHVKSPDFLDIENHRTLSFVSTGVTEQDGVWKLAGNLTIVGVSKPVVLEMEYHGSATDPWGNTRAGYSATTKIMREDWGLTWNAALEGGGFLVGKEVTIDIDVSTVLG